MQFGFAHHFVTVHIGFLVKRLMAKLANKRLYARVDHHMSLQIVLGIDALKSFLAEMAARGAFVLVSLRLPSVWVAQSAVTVARNAALRTLINNHFRVGCWGALNKKLHENVSKVRF